jgi:hypothetical protein
LRTRLASKREDGHALAVVHVCVHTQIRIVVAYMQCIFACGRANVRRYIVSASHLLNISAASLWSAAVRRLSVALIACQQLVATVSAATP